MSVFGTVVKTLTRHRDSASRLYLKDWTAGDLFPFKKDGYYTRGKWGGARRMGVCLRIDMPEKFEVGGVIYRLDVENNPIEMLSRCGYRMDLRAL